MVYKAQLDIDSDAISQSKSYRVKVDSKISEEAHELLLQKIQQCNTTISAYVRYLIEQDLLNKEQVDSIL